MFKVLKNEIIKMLTGKKFYVMSAILIGSIVLMTLIKDSNINAQNFVFETFAGTVIKPILPAFMIIVIAEVITEDYIHGTMKFSLMTPLKRSELIIGKLLFIDLYVLIFLAGGGMYMYDFVRLSGELNNINMLLVIGCALIYILIFSALSIFAIKRKDIVL